MLRLILRPPGSTRADWIEKAFTAARTGWATASFAVATLAGEVVKQTPRLLTAWHKLSLDRQFVVAVSLVILIGMMVIGLWVADRIKTGIVYDSAYEATLYMDRFVAPLSQELEVSSRISPEQIEKLDALLEGWMGRRIYSIKIWRADGVIAYSNWRDLIGRAYPLTADFRKALKGNIAAGIEDHSHEADGYESKAKASLIEIYAPVRSERTGEVIAVAEFYAVAATLEKQLRGAILSSWLLVGAIGVLMTGALYGIVWRGRLVIDDQRGRLEAQIVRLSDLLAENEQLQGSLRLAYKRTADINERFLRRVSADLHDGPAQLISLGLLKLHALEPGVALAAQNGAPLGIKELHRIDKALRDALSEVRAISAGLSLPDLASESLEGCIRRVARTHQEQTGTPVALDLELPPAAPLLAKTSIYRFVQEALNNAWRHAGGVDQRVLARTEGTTVLVTVSDGGPGIRRNPESDGRQHLGLIGLRDRIETLGGTMIITSSPAAGTALEARIDLAKVDRMETSHE